MGHPKISLSSITFVNRLWEHLVPVVFILLSYLFKTAAEPLPLVNFFICYYTFQLKNFYLVI